MIRVIMLRLLNVLCNLCLALLYLYRDIRISFICVKHNIKLIQLIARSGRREYLKHKKEVFDELLQL